MNVLPPVDPGSPPGSVVDRYYVRAPVEAAISPAPRAKEIANGHEEAEADHTADHEPGRRREENNCRVIVRHRDECRIHGHDRDVRPTADDDLGVAPQISVIPGLLALSLHCIHHVLLLRQKCVAEIGGPAYTLAIISSTEGNGRSACTLGSHGR